MSETDSEQNEHHTSPHLHPGSEGDKNVEFQAYLSFINNNGLDESTSQALRTALEVAYENSQASPLPTVWQPGSCIRTVDHYFAFKSAFESALPGMPFRLMINNPQDHKWYEVDTPYGTAVIDPSGIPQTQEELAEIVRYTSTHPRSFIDTVAGSTENNAAYVFRNKYKPYFGLKDRAPDFPKTIYSYPENFQASEDSIIRYNQKYL